MLASRRKLAHKIASPCGYYFAEKIGYSDVSNGESQLLGY
jgi:hypothetical protein